MNILTVNLLFSTLVFWIAAKLYLLPRLRELKPQAVLLPILLLHSFRHLGLMFLEPGATYAGIPAPFAYPAAFGDLLAALLALAAIPAVAMNWKGARVLVWIFSVEGTLDLGTAIALAAIYDAHVFMGPAYWIPAFWVPALLVTHYITFMVLLKYWKALGGPQAREPLMVLLFSVAVFVMWFWMARRGLRPSVGIFLLIILLAAALAVHRFVPHLRE